MDIKAIEMKNLKIPNSFALGFQFIIEDYDFKVDSVLVASLNSEDIEIVLKNNNKFIKLVKYREQYQFFFSNRIVLEKSEWFDWDIVKTFLEGKEEYSLPTTQNLSFAELYSESVQIKKGKQVLNEIKEGFSEILIILDEMHFEKIRKKLHAYERKRAKCLFG